MKDCVILGPTDFKKIKKFGNIKNIKKYLLEAAEFFANNFDSIIIIPDDGLPLKVAKVYKKLKPTNKVIGYIPGLAKKGENITKYYKYFDEIKDIGGGWFNLNTELTRKSDYVFCLGFSAGVLIELSSIKYNQIYMKLKTKIFIDQRCISSKLPKEVEIDLKNLKYFRSFESLKKLNLYAKNEKIQHQIL